MLTHEDDTSHERLHMPFPRLPSALRERFDCDSRAALSLRVFGHDARDLEINFTQTARPVLITHILSRCTRRDGVGVDGGESVEPDEEFFWRLPVGKRIECLLAIATAGGRETLPVVLVCPRESCAQQAEVELSLAELSSLQDRDGGAERFGFSFDGMELQFRKPTGSDQLDWLRSDFADGRAALAAMISTLALDETRVPLDDDGLDESCALALDTALDECDPLVNFSLLVRCPECGEEAAHEVDLERLALDKLRRAQRHLLASVHRLASHYHWSEREIFSVPHWRRAHYLSLIERAERR